MTLVRHLKKYTSVILQERRVRKNDRNGGVKIAVERSVENESEEV